MTFVEGCEIIRDVKGNYKIIRPSYVTTKPFNFKFELKGQQYDCFDVIYQYLRTIGHLKPHEITSLSHRIKATGLHISDALFFWHVCNGAMDKPGVFPPMKERYERQRIEFESITGIMVRL